MSSFVKLTQKPPKPMPGSFAGWLNSTNGRLWNKSRFFYRAIKIDTIHHDQIEAFGEMHGIRSEDTLKSAIAQPMNVWYYGNGDVYEIAAYAYTLPSQAYLTATNAPEFRPRSIFWKSTASPPIPCRKWRSTKQ